MFVGASITTDTYGCVNHGVMVVVKAAGDRMF